MIFCQNVVLCGHAYVCMKTCPILTRSWACGYTMWRRVLMRDRCDNLVLGRFWLVRVQWIQSNPHATVVGEISYGKSFVELLEIFFWIYTKFILVYCVYSFCWCYVVGIWSVICMITTCLIWANDSMSSTLIPHWRSTNAGCLASTSPRNLGDLKRWKIKTICLLNVYIQIWYKNIDTSYSGIVGLNRLAAYSLAADHFIRILVHFIRVC